MPDKCDVCDKSEAKAAKFVTPNGNLVCTEHSLPVDERNPEFVSFVEAFTVEESEFLIDNAEAIKTLIGIATSAPGNVMRQMLVTLESKMIKYITFSQIAMFQ